MLVKSDVWVVSVTDKYGTKERYYADFKSAKMAYDKRRIINHIERVELIECALNTETKAFCPLHVVEAKCARHNFRLQVM